MKKIEVDYSERQPEEWLKTVNSVFFENISSYRGRYENKNKRNYCCCICHKEPGIMHFEQCCFGGRLN